MEAVGQPCWSLAATPVPTPCYSLGKRDKGAYLGVKFHLGSQQFEVDAAELTVALIQVALWGSQKAVEIQGRLWKSLFPLQND